MYVYNVHIHICVHYTYMYVVDVRNRIYLQGEEEKNILPTEETYPLKSSEWDDSCDPLKGHYHYFYHGPPRAY